jgi:hypothetical protein
VFFAIVLFFTIFAFFTFFTFRYTVRSLHDQVATSAMLLREGLGKDLRSLNDALAVNMSSLRDDVRTDLTSSNDALTPSVSSLRDDVRKHLMSLRGELNTTNRELALPQQSAAPHKLEKMFAIIELEGIIRHLSRRCRGNAQGHNLIHHPPVGALHR